MLYTKNMIVNCRFQNTFKNAIPSGIELVSQGTTNFEVKSGKMSAIFTGSNSLSGEANAINDKLTNGISIFAWIYPTNLSVTTTQHIFRKEDSNNRILFSFQKNGTRITVGLNLNGVYFETGFPINISDYNNQWVHVGFTYNKATGIIRQYRNGVQIHSITKTGDWVYGGTARPFIGSKRETEERFIGNIYDFQIFNKALDESDVKRVMLGMSTMDNS